jgi:uncharacterized protein (DUF2062 family)
MIRKIFKKMGASQKVKPILEKYKIPPEYLSVNRKMTSKAVLIGLFIAFIPMPMQMVAVILMMPFVRFNVPIGLLMCWITNPITMPFIYYIEYQMGSFLLSTQMMPVQMTIEWFSANIDNIFIPLYVGALFFSTTLSSLSYYLINHFWRSSVDKNKKLHFSDRE